MDEFEFSKLGNSKQSLWDKKWEYASRDAAHTVGKKMWIAEKREFSFIEFSQFFIHVFFFFIIAGVNVVDVEMSSIVGIFILFFLVWIELNEQTTALFYPLSAKKVPFILTILIVFVFLLTSHGFDFIHTSEHLVYGIGNLQLAFDFRRTFHCTTMRLELELEINEAQWDFVEMSFKLETKRNLSTHWMNELKWEIPCMKLKERFNWRWLKILRIENSFCSEYVKCLKTRDIWFHHGARSSERMWKTRALSSWHSLPCWHNFDDISETTVLVEGCRSPRSRVHDLELYSSVTLKFLKRFRSWSNMEKRISFVAVIGDENQFCM